MECADKSEPSIHGHGAFYTLMGEINNHIRVLIISCVKCYKDDQGAMGASNRGTCLSLGGRSHSR